MVTEDPKIPTLVDVFSTRLNNDLIFDPTMPIESNFLRSVKPHQCIMGVKLLGDEIEKRIVENNELLDEIKKNNTTIKISFHKNVEEGENEFIMVLETQELPPMDLIVTTTRTNLEREKLVYQDLFHSSSGYVSYLTETFFRLTKKAYDISVVLGIQIEYTSEQVGTSGEYRVANPLFRKTVGMFDLAEGEDGALFGVCQQSDAVPAVTTMMFGSTGDTQFTFQGKNKRLTKCKVGKKVLYPAFTNKKDLKYVSFDKYKQF